MMKKLLTLLLIMLMILSLIGCNTKQDNSTPIKEEETQETIQEESEQEEIVEEEVVVEETKKEEKTISQDITKMSFWVVFYDQYGNELQREALKYGTVPEYKSWLPEGFDKWIYKKSGKDVGKLKAIIGNTYYQAVCRDVYHSSSAPEPEPTPTPVPEPIEDKTLHKGDVIRIKSEDSGYDIYFVLKIDGNEVTLVNKSYQGMIKFSNDDNGYKNSLLDEFCNTTFYGALSSTLQNAIIEKPINLYKYEYNDSVYDVNTHILYADSEAKVLLETINRKVYSLDIEDIEEYVGSTSYSIDDVAPITGNDCWLRCVSEDGYFPWYVETGDKEINRQGREIDEFVRATFVIDLTKNIDYEKLGKVSLLTFSDEVMIQAYGSKGGRVVDLDFNGAGFPTFGVTKTYGSNTLTLMDLGDDYYMVAFTIPYNQLRSLFNHNDLIALEPQITDEMRFGDTVPPYGGAASWAEVSNTYDDDMFWDVIYAIMCIDICYNDSQAAYNTIINKIKPYLLTPNLTITDNVKLYTTTG